MVVTAAIEKSKYPKFKLYQSPFLVSMSSTFNVWRIQSTS